MTMTLTQTRLHLLTTLLLVALYNTAFFRHVLAVYPWNGEHALALISLTIGFGALVLLLLTLIGWRYTTKPVLAVLLLLASTIAYFANNYDAIIDRNMIRNILQTNPGEVRDLLNVKLVAYLLVLGLLPAILVLRLRLQPTSWRQEMMSKAKIAFLCLAIIFGLFFLSKGFFYSFFREQATLRYYTNPTFALYSLGKYVKKSLTIADTALQPVGTDAHVAATATDRRLMILVVGEAARADHFSLNGYSRQTNPLLARDGVISFSQMYSSGTSTAESLPRMFSVYPRAQYQDEQGSHSENLLDVLRHAGVQVLWRDNNSDSKGVALRVPYQDYSRPEVNTVCDSECRDEGMLVGLQEYIEGIASGDIVIVLHQMGNHGPAYAKRYPSAYERFTPVCATNQLNECSIEAIANAYDNAILYTDAFLDKVIGLLKRNSGRFNTAMLYFSDHGESLGEYGVYLHGLPYAMAPDSQKHIASMFWLSDTFGIDQAVLRAKAGARFSQDNLFHTVLGLLDIETKVYNPDLDITREAVLSAHHLPASPKGRQKEAVNLQAMAPEHGTSARSGLDGSSTAALPLWLMVHLGERKK